ncbi:hypothetical protein N5079_13260 [Planotetraspora sp. A-T 1434]|uniref:hypothetical protein n=1 Tax=Planotetraspora sp. A-T 1434 TaxID=2979219 RepID=UPI0021C062AF|nr:hypothetical protein [Planotetraspora sp. A-T 1434]MCT9931184.1 hypothetical protein [Planotetraspora sp. A-T 1434]
MSFNDLIIFFGLAYEVIAPLVVGVGVLAFIVGVTGTLLIVLYALTRRFFRLRRGPRLPDDREEQGFVLEWLR